MIKILKNILSIIKLYGALYLSLLFNFFFGKRRTKEMYNNFGNFLLNEVKTMNIESKIKFYKKDKIDEKKWGILVANHNSIIDCLVLVKLFMSNNIGWNDIKTVSRISKRMIQNKVLNIFDMLLLKKNLLDDTHNLNRILHKWRRENKPLQIILFPEGNIYNKNLSNYNNLLNPTNGIFELLRYKLSEIENVYDFTILYKIKNKRLIGEYEIITNLSNDDLEISVEMEKYNISQIDEKWIFNVWDKKDKVIERHL